ncbi:hypothetical protein L1987_21687 [Smallanthus sonchifolius]|uniref:Uncharacterized protein n=1 Tax=Smallanthus sonchifolius TaxID=185202 RepID=A0ACB9IEA0_9ASTR|nr:hypothetical protein L1987_21687 [Smallanthus sonchifolius]
MRVREKILVLIDTWQEAFGGRGGKITAHYYRAYEELRFPNRSSNTVPVITPPVSYGHHQAGTGSSTRHEPNEDVSLSTLESMRDVLDLLSEMLQAIDPNDRKAVKDEVITDLYDQCRSNQKKLGYTLSSATSDEEILQQGIQFNEALQYVIEKHDAIATGSPVPGKPLGLMTQRPRVKHVECVAASALVASSSSNEIQEEQPNSSAPISSRCFETQTVVSPQDGAGVSASKTNKKAIPVSDTSLAMALIPSDPPPPANKKTADEDMIDLLSLALSPAEPSTSNPNQTFNGSTVAETQPQVQPPMNSYVVPWAQTQPQLEYEPQQPPQTVQQQSNYIPPPWAPTPGYYCNPYASNHSPASYYTNGSGNGAGSNQYTPSYRLFEDLNVLGNLRTSSTPGASGSSMLGARK